jgi:hypothetical protein
VNVESSGPVQFRRAATHVRANKCAFFGERLEVRISGLPLTARSEINS